VANLKKHIVMRFFRIILLIVIPIQIYAKSDNPEQTTSFCEIIGMIDNINSNDSLIDCFYPDENDVSNYFINLVNSYEKETSTKHSISKTISLQGHICIYSKYLKSLITQFYKIDTNNIATINEELLLRTNEINKYAFLRGLYLRHGNANEIDISCGYYKIKTIFSIMESLQIKGLKSYVISGDYTPTGYIIIFDTSDKLDKNIKLKKGYSKLDSKIYKQINVE